MRSIFANLTGNATLTLPAVASSSGRELWITVATSDTTARTLTIDPNAAELIDGSATIIVRPQGNGISNAYRAVHIQCDGAAWYILECRMTP